MKKHSNALPIYINSPIVKVKLSRNHLSTPLLVKWFFLITSFYYNALSIH